MSTPPDPHQQPGPNRPGPGGRGSDLSTSSTGLIKALFDFNFDTFITPKIVKIVYVVATVLVGLATLGMIFSALAMMTDGGVAVLLGLIFLVAAPILGLVYLAFIRMSLELYYAVIRLSEDVHHGPGRL
ncbi:DUF4282 domain-containing protein [Ornithinimicrobium pratense]|nr:DUF4282 domain-containing protein [Ornithinimicrobium pratense]